MNEMNRLRAIMLGLSSLTVRLWRNNCGALKDAEGRLVRYGVANPGGSDLIGWKVVTVTPDMVGRKVAIFTAIEVKGERGKPTEAQAKFLACVALDGGLAGVARSLEEAQAVIDSAGKKYETI
jgi:hypothetical protein